MTKLQTVEDAITLIYKDAYAAYANKKVRDLPRLDPTVGLLGQLWNEFDSLIKKA